MAPHWEPYPTDAPRHGRKHEDVTGPRSHNEEQRTEPSQPAPQTTSPITHHTDPHTERPVRKHA
eukprot:6434605-Prorocentrum_lima.AAC.1